MIFRHLPVACTRRRIAVAVLAPVLAFGGVTGCGSDDVPDEGNMGPDNPSANPTTGGVTQ